MLDRLALLVIGVNVVEHPLATVLLAALLLHTTEDSDCPLLHTDSLHRVPKGTDEESDLPYRTVGFTRRPTGTG